MKKPARKVAPKGGGTKPKTDGPGDAATTHRPFQALAGHAKRRTPVDATPPAPEAPQRAAPEASSPGAPRQVERFADLVPYVKPLRDEKRRVPRNVRPPRRAGDERRFEMIDDGHCVEGRRVDVDPRELGLLKRGERACDARLDLHGLGAIEARAAMERFLARSAREGAKVVEVIHGKGKHSVAGVGVLRGELGAWLSQGAAAAVVLAFTSIRDAHGEVGRLRVLLAAPRA
jgi:DNA-nicking Smr family endonuclease